MRKQSDSEKILGRKRERKRASRSKKLGERSNRKYGRREKNKFYQRRSYALESFAKHVKSNEYSYYRDKEYRVTIPKTFSIIDAPEETITIMYQLAQVYSGAQKLNKLYFDHSNMEYYDLAAAQILGHLAAEINRLNRRKKPKLGMSGNFPKDHQASRLLRGIGVIRSFGLTDKYLSIEEKNSLEIFAQADNRALQEVRTSSQVTPRDTAVRKFADHINNCLGRSGYRLTPEGLQSLCIISGEVIDNAIQHSHGDDWVIAGYLDTETEDNICEISAFNFGRTISQTLEELPNDHYTVNIIQPYLNKHTNSGFFGKRWTKEDLLTLVALQGNVSSKNESDDDTRGGGTVDLLEFFKKIYEERGSNCKAPMKMAIQFSLL